MKFIFADFKNVLRALFSLWVIRRHLHIDKIHKNKIHFYNMVYQQTL